MRSSRQPGTGTQSPMTSQVQLSQPTNQDANQQTHTLPNSISNTSQVHVITCPCHTELLIQALQNLATTSPGDYNYEYSNINIAPSPQITLRDLISAFLPLHSRTERIVAGILDNTPYTIPQAVSLLTALPRNLLSRIPSPFSGPAIPCLPPSAGQVYTALKHRIHLYLLQHNLFVLVLVTKSYELYMSYFSIWVWFNLINLPLTFALGMFRILKEVAAGWIWSVVGSFLMVEGNEMKGSAAGKDNRKGNSFSDTVDAMTWFNEKAMKYEEDFLIVDLD